MLIARHPGLPSEGDQQLIDACLTAMDFVDRNPAGETTADRVDYIEREILSRSDNPYIGKGNIFSFRPSRAAGVQQDCSPIGIVGNGLRLRL